MGVEQLNQVKEYGKRKAVEFRVSNYRPIGPSYTMEIFESILDNP